MRIIDNKSVEKGRTIDYLKSFKIGQGLNISKEYFFTNDECKFLGISRSKCVPIMLVDDCGQYSWKKTNNFLVIKNFLTMNEIKFIESNGKKTFDNKSTKKSPPVLIMPRGIGSKHYCSYNESNGFSASAVDVYGENNRLTDDILRLWLFFNSSVCWLLREITGRKNLGGGLLKAEAVDLKSFPIFYAFDDMDKINKIFSTCKDKSVMSLEKEIVLEHRKDIDRVVYEYLGLDEKMQKYIERKLLLIFSERYKKSKT